MKQYRLFNGLAWRLAAMSWRISSEKPAGGIENKAESAVASAARGEIWRLAAAQRRNISVSGGGGWPSAYRRYRKLAAGENS
jgi:hypothetical protein